VRITDCCVQYLMLITILGQNKVLCVASSNSKPYLVETRCGWRDSCVSLQYYHLRFDLMLRFGIPSYTYLRFCIPYYFNYIYAWEWWIMPIPVAARSKALVCCRPPGGIAVSDLGGGMDVCLF
jgi:hypothetical protein